MVKLTIDTASDSHDHIKHVIDLLQRIVGVSATSSAPAPMAMFDAPAAANPLGDLFGAPQASPAPSMGMFDSPIPQNPVPDPQHGLGNPLHQSEEREEKPELEFY